MNYQRENNRINKYLQEALRLALKHGDNTVTGRTILRIASKTASQEIALMKANCPHETICLYEDRPGVKQCEDCRRIL